MSILLITGIVAAVLLPIAGFIGWKFHAKSKAEERLNASFERAVAVLPPLELRLQPASLEGWMGQARLESDEKALREAGLTHQGYFTDRSSMRKLQVSLWQYKNCLTVALCENQLNGDGFDAVVQAEYSSHAIVRLSGGGVFGITNNETAGRLQFSEENPVVVTRELNPVALMRLIKKHKPNHIKLLPSPDSKVLFTSYFECQSHWLWQAEQLYSAELQLVLEEQGVEVSDQLLEQLREHGETFLSRIYSHKVLERLGQAPKMNEEYWKKIRNKCVVVHEKMSAEDLSRALFRSLGDLTSKQEKQLESLSESGPLHDPISSFREYLDSFKADTSPKRFAKMQIPVRAEIYLAE